jgi:hypothetical protein
MGPQAAWAKPIFFCLFLEHLEVLGHVAMKEGQAESLRFFRGGLAGLAQAGEFAHVTGAADT